MKVCDKCGKENTECAEFTKKVFGLFKVKMNVCQSCLSKAFRLFKKGK